MTNRDRVKVIEEKIINSVSEVFGICIQNYIDDHTINNLTEATGNLVSMISEIKNRVDD